MPLHSLRAWRVLGPFSPEQLARKLHRYTWCLCQGFECDGLLWLNDATSEDSAQEYAVVCKATNAQVESITVSWCDEPKLAAYARKLRNHDDAYGGIDPATNLAHPAGVCDLCG